MWNRSIYLKLALDVHHHRSEISGDDNYKWIRLLGFEPSAWQQLFIYLIFISFCKLHFQFVKVRDNKKVSSLSVQVSNIEILSPKALKLLWFHTSLIFSGTYSSIPIELVHSKRTEHTFIALKMKCCFLFPLRMFLLYLLFFYNQTLLSKFSKNS